MKSEHDRIDDIIGEEATAKLEKAGWGIIDTEIEVAQTLSDEQLNQITEDLTKEDVEKWHALYRRMVGFKIKAKQELAWRPITKRANEAMDKPGASGVFCVFHNCDMKDCPEGSHDDE